MAGQDNKKRLICLMKILTERTDAQNILNVNDLCSILKNEYDIESDRRTIYTEVNALRDFGFDIIQQNSQPAVFCPAYRIGQFDQDSKTSRRAGGIPELSAGDSRWLSGCDTGW